MNLISSKIEIEENQYLTENIQDPVIKNRIVYNLTWYIKRACGTKFWFYCFTILTIVCPVVSGIVLTSPLEDSFAKMLSAIILGISTVAAALLPLYGFHKKWTLYRNQAEEIKHILITAYCEKNVSDEELLHRIEESIKATDEKWTNHQENSK